MFPIETVHYSAALRFKKGEGAAIIELDSEIKDRFAPHLIIPPLSERDVELNRRLSSAEFAPTQVERIFKCWDRRSFFLDLRLVRFNIDPDSDAAQYRWFLDAAVKKGCSVIPVFDLKMSEARVVTLRDHWLASRGGLALRLSWSDLDRPRLGRLVGERLLKLVAKPSECVLILDMSDAELSGNPDFVQSVMNGLGRLQELGLWRRMIVEATKYPEHNPATENGSILVPRQEWINWKTMIGLDRGLANVAMFGDYGADNAKMRFKGGSIPIAHFRYATFDKWLIARGGAPSATGDGTIHQAACMIVESKAFAGETFSAGDEFIMDCAMRRIGPGTPSDWRMANMNHHITRVVTDLGELYSSPLSVRRTRRKSVQAELPLLENEEVATRA